MICSGESRSDHQYDRHDDSDHNAVRVDPRLVVLFSAERCVGGDFCGCRCRRGGPRVHYRQTRPKHRAELWHRRNIRVRVMFSVFSGFVCTTLPAITVIKFLFRVGFAARTFALNHKWIVHKSYVLCAGGHSAVFLRRSQRRLLPDFIKMKSFWTSFDRVKGHCRPVTLIKFLWTIRSIIVWEGQDVIFRTNFYN